MPNILLDIVELLAGSCMVLFGFVTTHRAVERRSGFRFSLAMISLFLGLLLIRFVLAR